MQNNTLLEMACFKTHSLKISVLQIFPENVTQKLFPSQHVGQAPPAPKINQNDWLISNTLKEPFEKCYMHWIVAKIKLCYLHLRWKVAKTIGSGQLRTMCTGLDSGWEGKHIQLNNRRWKTMIQEIRGGNNLVCILSDAKWHYYVLSISNNFYSVGDILSFWGCTSAVFPIKVASGKKKCWAKESNGWWVCFTHGDKHFNYWLCESFGGFWYLIFNWVLQLLSISLFKVS